MTGLGTSHDIDVSGGLVWAACDGTDSPVKAFDTSGTLVDFIPGSLVGNEARGVAFESANIIWVSNPSDDTLYRIDLCLGTGGGGIPPARPVLISASENPFHSSVVIDGPGFGEGAILEVFDTSGHAVVRTGFSGTFCWDGGGFPAGIYVVRVSEGTVSSHLGLTKL